MRPIFITGIGTGIGKTIVSAILVEKFCANYWKPIQSGDLDQSDTLMVSSLISNAQSIFYPEAYRLTKPFSPHKSADLDGIVIDPLKIKLPVSKETLIIEGAGGLMVPLNANFLMIDLIKQLDAEIILVSKNYLGSINHTLLSAESLKTRSISVKGIIFNGDADTYTEKFILDYTGWALLGNLPPLDHINQQAIKEAGQHLKSLI
ncbi:MAG: dethiobiotin synthase [Sphingobacteriaceae bacterium]